MTKGPFLFWMRQQNIILFVSSCFNLLMSVENKSNMLISLESIQSGS